MSPSCPRRDQRYKSGRGRETNTAQAPELPAPLRCRRRSLRPAPGAAGGNADLQHSRLPPGPGKSPSKFVRRLVPRIGRRVEDRAAGQGRGPGGERRRPSQAAGMPHTHPGRAPSTGPATSRPARPPLACPTAAEPTAPETPVLPHPRTPPAHPRGGQGAGRGCAGRGGRRSPQAV